MRKNKIIYWSTTAIVALLMLFSAYNYFTSPEISGTFHRLGFADYFRKELGIAKILGALTLLVPQVPRRVKEWAYTGFGIVFISASVAHYNNGDPGSAIIVPIVLLLILIVSNIYLDKTRTNEIQS